MYQSKHPLNTGYSLSSVLIMNKQNNILCLAMQDLTQPFQCVHSDRLVMFQIVDGSGVNAIFIYQSIGGFPVLFHCFPQRRIAYQYNHLIFKRLFLLSFEKMYFTILKYVSIMYLPEVIICTKAKILCSSFLMRL